MTDEHLLWMNIYCLFVWNYSIKRAEHEKVKIHCSWARPNVEPKCIWVWWMVRPIIFGLNHALSPNACGFVELPNPSSLDATKHWAQTPSNGSKIFSLDEIGNQKYFYLGKTINQRYFILMEHANLSLTMKRSTRGV